MNKTLSWIIGISLSIALIVGGTSLAYYFAYFKPNLEKQQVEFQQNQQRKEALQISIKEDEIKNKKEECRNTAQERAKDFLKTKSEMNGGSVYKEAVKKGLFLKEDYEYQYNDCLQLAGIDK